MAQEPHAMHGFDELSRYSRHQPRRVNQAPRTTDQTGLQSLFYESHIKHLPWLKLGKLPGGMISIGDIVGDRHSFT